MQECSRCKLLKPQSFMIRSEIPGFTMVDFVDRPPEIVMSCKDCLTDQEIAHFLIPVALFVVRILLRHTFWNENPEKQNKLAIEHFGYAEAWLKFRHGLAGNERAKALKSLDALIS